MSLHIFPSDTTLAIRENVPHGYKNVFKPKRYDIVKLDDYNLIQRTTIRKN